MQPSTAKKEWLFPDAYLPDTDNQISHESICILNLNDADASMELTLFFEDKAPQHGYVAMCPAMRTKHIRLDKLTDAQGYPIPRCVPYAIRLLSDQPVLCQYTRVDATQPAYSLMTTMGL